MPPKPRRKPPKPPTPVTPPAPTVTPPKPVAGPTPSVTPTPTSTTAATVAVKNSLKGGSRPIDKTGGKGYSMPKGLTADQRRRKVGKQKYYWKDKSGQWHYHISGKTTTDRSVPNPVDKGKQQKKASADYLKDRIAKAKSGKSKSGAVKTTVATSQVVKPSSPVRGIRHPVKHAARTGTPQPVPTPSRLRKKGIHYASAQVSPAQKPRTLQTGVSAKVYDSAKARLKKRRNR